MCIATTYKTSLASQPYFSLFPVGGARGRKIRLDTLSRSASDKYTGIIEKTGSQNASAFHRSINGTLFSGEFSKSLTSEREAVGAYFASGFIDQ